MTENSNYRALRTILDQIDAARQQVHESLSTISELIEEHFPDECAGSCECCGRLLLYGDKGWRYDDGPICCSECSPTWEQGKDGFASSEDEEARAAFEIRLAGHLAAGGSPDDQMPLMEI